MKAHTREPNPPRRWLEHTVGTEEAGQTVEQILTGSLGISRRMIQRLSRSKGILRNRKAPFLGAKVRAGDTVSARIASDEDAGMVPVAMELDIVYEDGELLVVNKPPFVLVHPTKPEHRNTLAHGVAFHLQQQGLRTKIRPVHRIDRDTSGLVLFAKSGYAHQRLDRQLRERTVEREYLALVHGALPDDTGVIDLPIGRDKQPQSQLRVVRAGGEPAITHYHVVERLADATLVRLAMETGRTHQIRVHMAHLGHPVLGDRQYGGERVSLIRRQALHASRLAFLHPSSGEPVSCQARLPEDMAGLRERLRGEPAP